MKKLFTLIIICGLFANSVYGSGFQLNEHGARAMAMAGAFTGLANDPSAIYFNPAGITQLKGTQFLAGATLILPISSYTAPKPQNTLTDMNGQVFNPINFYITQQIGDKLAIGLGINNQYGLGTKWDQNWVGRSLAVETKVETYFFTPVIAYKLFENLSVSAGPAIAVGNVTISKKSVNAVNPLGPEFLTLMEGTSDVAIGFTAGILYKASDKLQFGLTYRSEMTFDFSGTATSTPASFTFVHPILKVPVTVPWPNGDITASLTTPQNLTFGLAYMASDNFTTTFDFQYVGWSSYDKLAVTFANYNPASPTFSGTYTNSVDRNYENTFIVRWGFEYKPTDSFALRGGLLYDRNPIPDGYVDPTLPDANRVGINLGFGGKLTDHLGLDISYMYLIFADRTIGNSKFGFNGTYSNSAHLFGLDFSYSL
ncbi:MAG: outer membrane protein transport protein [Ignavibacteriales bacterium]|nr:outer membrane protein transport protein [Ignavibacteriales bacterium]